MSDEMPRAGEFGLTWIKGWTGFWVSLGQWLTGDGGRFPWTRHQDQLPMGYPTHAFLVLDDGVIIEAQPGGARVGHVSQYNDRPVMYSKLPLIEAQRAVISPTALAYEGTPYSFLDYVYLALWRLGIKSKWLQEKVKSSGHMICSQLVDEILTKVGFHLFDDGRLPQDVTPGDLFAYLVSTGEWDARRW